MTMATRAQIVECARTYLGAPFAHQGRSRIFGIDCVGLPLCVGRDLGLPVPDYRNYDRQTADDTVLLECRKNLQEIESSGMRPGDILCMRTPKFASHTAIVTELLGQIGIIHAWSLDGKVVEHNLDLKWSRRIAGVFLFPGVED